MRILNLHSHFWYSFFRLDAAPSSGVPHLRGLQHVLLNHQHLLIGQTHVRLAALGDSERLAAQGLSSPGPEDTGVRLVRLKQHTQPQPTGQRSRWLHTQKLRATVLCGVQSGVWGHPGVPAGLPRVSSEMKHRLVHTLLKLSIFVSADFYS